MTDHIRGLLEAMQACDADAVALHLADDVLTDVGEQPGRLRGQRRR